MGWRIMGQYRRAEVATTQFWLDVDKFTEYKKGRYGPWFGPFTGQTLGMGVALNGPGDNNGLLAVGALSAAGYAYNLGSGNNDDGVAIRVIYQSAHDMSSPAYLKSITDLEMETKAATSAHTMNIIDTIGP